MKKVLDLNPKLAAKKSGSLYDIERAMELLEDKTERGKAIEKTNSEESKS